MAPRSARTPQGTPSFFSVHPRQGMLKITVMLYPRRPAPPAEVPFSKRFAVIIITIIPNSQPMSVTQAFTIQYKHLFEKPNPLSFRISHHYPLALPNPGAQIWSFAITPTLDLSAILLRFRPLKPCLQRLPALLIIPLLHFLAFLQSPFCHPNHKTAFEHKCHAFLPNLHRLQLCARSLRVRHAIGPMRTHHVVQTCASGLETAATLGVVITVNETHELGHGVTVVPGGPECLFRYQPAGRKNDKVSHSGAQVFRWGCENREDAWIWMVVGDGANGTEASEIVFIGVVEAMPGDDVKGRVRLRSRKEAASKLREESICGRAREIFNKRCGGGLKVAGIGQAIGPNGTKLGELEVVLVELEDVAADWAIGERNMVTNSARNDAYFTWTDEQTAKLGANIKDSVL